MANDEEREADRLRREEKEVEAIGATWARRSDEFLIGYVAQSRPAQFHTPALVEIQRRLAVAIRASGDCAATQTDQVIKLTRVMKIYTIVLAAIGVVQIGLMLWKG